MQKYLSGFLGQFNPSQLVQIEAGQTESNAFSTGGFKLAGLILPSVFTGTALTFLVGDSLDGFAAQGQITFSGTCSAADTLEINGVELTFVASNPGDNEIEVGATAQETCDNLFAFLEATIDDDLLACTYEQYGVNILVTAIDHGTGGNAYTFTKSSTDITLNPSGGTLSGGGFRPLYNSSNSQISMTVAAGRAYSIDPANFNGVWWMKLKSGTTETALRNIICSLKG